MYLVPNSIRGDRWGKYLSHLSPIVIKEIKQSQELVHGREAEITTTEKLQAP